MEEVRDDRARFDDDDPPSLSVHAITALKEFLAEQNRARAAEDATATGNGVSVGEEEKVALVAEDWRLSQFWYEEETAEAVAKEVVTLCETLETPSVACVACPTLYAYLKIGEGKDFQLNYPHSISGMVFQDVITPILQA